MVVRHCLKSERDGMIGILTLHYGYNEGAILQAYALAQLLKRARREVRIIDHRYPEKVAIYQASMDRRKEQLQHEIEHSLPLSESHFFSRYENETWRFIEKHYSTLVIGSDQVWRLRYARRLFGLISFQRDPFIGKFPNVYWPPPSLKVRKVSYAASIGDTDPGVVPVGHRRRMAASLDAFEVLGVRDERTADFISRLSSNLASRIRMCPDPTLLWSWNFHAGRDSLRAKLAKLGLRHDRPICVLGVARSNWSVSLAKQLKQCGWAVIGYSSWDDFSEFQLAQIGVSLDEWISLFGIAQLCITDRYHCTIFAILQKCPVFVCDPAGEANHRGKSRIGTLAGALHVNDCVRQGYPAIQEIIPLLGQLELDWCTVEKYLCQLRQCGNAVIEEILEQ